MMFNVGLDVVEAFGEVLVEDMMIVGQLQPSLDLSLSVNNPLLYDLFGLGASLQESLLQFLDWWGINE